MSRHEQSQKKKNHDATQSNPQQSDVEQRNRSFRVLRCFCGCTALSYEEIECLATMTVSHLVIHKTGKKILQNFLRIGQQPDESEVLMFLQCYEKSDQFLHKPHEIHDSIEEFLSLCPSFTWEQRIMAAIQSNDEQILRQALIDIKQECVQNIESHNDYDRFRGELLRKIGKT